MAARRTFRLVARTDGRTILNHLLVADNFWSRFVGVQFRSPLPLDSGLVIVPCPAIHTFFVRFSLDLIWIGRQAQVLELRRSVRPWRTARGPKGTVAVIETACGAIAVQVGERLAVESTGASFELSRSLAFMAR
jgi:uncharacterized membrane protein (UPF0127 family)